MSETSSYPDEGAMEKTSLERRLRLLAWTQRFGLGTLWRVGENLWESLLPKDGPNAYVQRSDRINHPGMCVSATCDSLHAVVPMWYGTHNSGRHCFMVLLDGPGKAPTYFGHFRAVSIDRDLIGEIPDARSKKQEHAREKFERNHVVPYDKNKTRLNASELEELKSFIKKNFMLVGVSA